MIYFDEQMLRKSLSHAVLADRIGEYMAEGTTTPQRIHLDYPNPGRKNGTLLLMPSWRAGKYLGVKTITITPDNGDYGLPSIHGHYLLFAAQSGQLLATMDGKVLTNIRTATASLLMAKHLANPAAKNYLIVGTGNLVNDYVAAFSSSFDFDNIWIWGRSAEKTAAKVVALNKAGFEVKAVQDLAAAQHEADIISTITLSTDPLVFQKYSRPGQHYDLVGAYKPDRRETDGKLIQAAQVWVDTPYGALHEAGDIVLAIQEGLFEAENIVGTMAEVLHQKPVFQANLISTFKSVGHAAQDLAAAGMAFEGFQKQNVN